MSKSPFKEHELMSIGERVTIDNQSIGTITAVDPRDTCFPYTVNWDGTDYATLCMRSQLMRAPANQTDQTYTTFIRSATNFEEFSSHEKITQAEGLTLAEARTACEEFNSQRTDSQKATGTKMEFESE